MKKNASEKSSRQSIDQFCISTIFSSKLKGLLMFFYMNPVEKDYNFFFDMKRHEEYFVSKIYKDFL